jgi:stage III sporulation protein AE
MKKLVVFLFVLICSLLFLTINVSALDAEEEMSEALDTEELENNLPESAEDVVGDMSVEDSLDIDGGIKRLTDKIGNAFGEILGNTLKNGCTILIIVMLSSVVSTFLGNSENIKRSVKLVTILAITAVSINNMNSFIGIGTDTLDELNSFSKVLLPCLTSALAASGAATTAAVKYAATTLFLDVLITISNNIAVPLIYGYIAVSSASAAFGGKAIAAAANLIKWIINSLLTIIVLVFTLYITLTGVVSGSTDAAAVKLTKTAISALPVVGGVISDAASTVLGAISILKNAIGIFGLLTVCAVCAIPIIRLGTHYFVYKGAEALTRTIADESVSGLVGALGNAAGFILGLVGACGVMLFISVISVLRTVTGG